MEGDVGGDSFFFGIKISTHALRMEGDSAGLIRRRLIQQFLPTPSAWRATRQSLLVGRRARDFYPRPPHGGRRTADIRYRGEFKFLPTPSAWRATSAGPSCCAALSISTHALRMEGDCNGCRYCQSHLLFLPTPSAWRATSSEEYGFSDIFISTHALRMEGDPRERPAIGRIALFLPTPSAWRATANMLKCRRAFQQLI